MKPISFAVGINDLPKEISGFGNLNLERFFKSGLHVHCNSDEIPNATTCKMMDSHVECYEECGQSKYICDCEVERFVSHQVLNQARLPTRREQIVLKYRIFRFESALLF